MTTAPWIEREKAVYMPVFRRTPLMLVKGQGPRVWDDQGKAYLDFVEGIACNVLGHCHPALVNAITQQAGQLMHVSSLYYNEPQLKLAEMLVANSCMDRVFFQNSGAEAVEGAIKAARRYGMVHLNGAYQIITAWHSFHGRTLVTTAATGKEAMHDLYRPVPEGFISVDYNDLEALKAATTDKTCAVMLEVVQGEGGVYPADKAYLEGVRKWCDERGILLIFDEVQTGMGRLGTLFGYQTYGVEPDVMSLAKGLAGGFPIGAFLTKEKATAMGPGDHGSTFGGNPLACAAGIAVLNELVSHDLPANAAKVGGYLMDRLRNMETKRPIVREVRGYGCLIAVEFTEDISGKLVERCIQNGLLVNPVLPNAIRLMPPLNLTTAEADEALGKIHQALEDIL